MVEKPLSDKLCRRVDNERGLPMGRTTKQKQQQQQQQLQRAYLTELHALRIVWSTKRPSAERANQRRQCNDL